MGKKICGAKTRAGTPCKRAPRYNGRCNLHGGKSWGWFASPRYKHGLYSKYMPRPLAIRELIRKAMLEEQEDRQDRDQKVD